MHDAPPMILPPISDPLVLDQIDRLAQRYATAAGPTMRTMRRIGNGAESLLARLPDGVRRQLDDATRAGLSQGFKAAAGSRRLVRDRGDWFNRLSATLTGAAGGAGGLAGALIELPFTVTLLLRAMLGIAEEHGLEPDSDEVRLECLRIFAASGPMADSDDSDLGLLAVRMSVTGQSVQGLIGKVAPRLSVSLGQKLAAQSAPVIGALAGATINYGFARYYQELARVHFGLMRLSHETGLPREALIELLRLSLQRRRD